jgi:hypothetical protein
LTTTCRFIGSCHCFSSVDDSVCGTCV